MDSRISLFPAVSAQRVGDGGGKGAKTKQALMSWEKGEREQWKRCLARSHQHQVTQSNLEAEE